MGVGRTLGQAKSLFKRILRGRETMMMTTVKRR